MNFTRREILASFLGLPFALAACETRNEINKIEGEILGASVDLGHRIRDDARFEVSAGNVEIVRVAIIGGGAAGLSAARKLKQKGLENFVLLELEKEIGGTARSGKSNLCGYPWGAHYLPVPRRENAELVALLSETDLLEGFDNTGELVIKEQFLCRDPEERVFYKGRWYEGLYLNAGASNEDKRQIAAFQKEIDFWVAWRDANGKRAFTLPVANCSKDSFSTDLDKISFADWLREKGFDSPRLLWYCDYACRDDYGLKSAQTSAWAGLFYFCSRVPEVGRESAAFITFPEGNGRFINYLQAQIKDKIRLNQAAVEIIPTEKNVEIITFDAQSNQVRKIIAEKVIFAAPVFLSKYLIRDFRQNTPDFVGKFEHNAWLVANLFLKDRPKNRFPKDYPLAWDNVIYESPSLGYVNATHQKGIDYGETILTYYLPLCEGDFRTGRNKLLAMDWQACADVVLTDLSRAHKDLRELTTRIDVMRWGHAMISPQTGFIFGGAREKAQKPFRNIHFAHSDLSGLALFEEAFFHGIRAANEIIGI